MTEQREQMRGLFVLALVIMYSRVRHDKKRHHQKVHCTAVMAVNNTQLKKCSQFLFCERGNEIG